MEKESYFNISTNDQREILQYYSDKLSVRDTILEKDIWLCWVLDVIFNIPNRHPMAFKGGTSLSKVFGAINRFSEDVDITLDYSYFDISGSFSPDMSKTKAKLFSEKLKGAVKEYRNREDIEYFSRYVDNSEIEENDYNLSVSTYVEKEDTREKIDIKVLNKEISETVKKIDELRASIDKIVRELESDE